MSQENVDLIRQVFEQWNEAGELPWELYDAEVRFTTRGGLGRGITYTGPAALQEAVATFTGVWESLRGEVREIIGADDVFVTVVLWHLRGRGSGVELEVEEGWAFWMRGGKVVQVEQHGSKDEALEAAGLSE
jgi:hypothetical protein